MLRSPVSAPAREAVSPPPAPAPAEPPPQRPAPQPLEAPQPSTVTPRLDPVVLNRSEREHAITLRHEEEYAANRGLTWNGIGCASLPRPPHLFAQFRSRICLTLKTSNAADKPVGESTVMSDSVAPWAGDKPEEDGPVDSDYVDRMVRTNHNRLH